MSTEPWEEGWFYIDEDAPEGECGFTTKYPDEAWPEENFQCRRKVWNGTGQCIWHAKEEEKPVEDLEQSRIDGPERLDGAFLVGLKLGYSIPFRECILIGANLRETDFLWADFSGADLRKSQFNNSNLSGAELSNTNMEGANLSSTSVRNADLSSVSLFEANIENADLVKADISESDLSNANLSGSDFRRANLSNSNLHSATLSDTNFGAANLSEVNFPVDLKRLNFKESDLSGADLVWANLSNSLLQGTNLTEADLSEADLSNAYLNAANLSDAVLFNADLSGTELFDVTAIGTNFELATFNRTLLLFADFSQAKFYSATFDRVHINHVTKFGGHYEDEIAEQDADPNSAPSPWDKAASCYRQIEEISRARALSRQARRAYRDRKDVRRREYRRKTGLRAKARWFRAAVSRWVMGYGDRPSYVLAWSGFIVLVSALLYPWAGVETGSDVLMAAPTTLSGAATAFGNSLYFSTITFITLGYGGFHPVGWGRAVATAESGLGALLMALLVFVLGRRATW